MTGARREAREAMSTLIYIRINPFYSRELSPHRYTCVLVCKLCKEGQPHIARQLFDTIPRPKTIEYDTIIIGFICNNMSLEALSVYSQMKHSCPYTKPDSYTYSSVLKACAEALNFMIGKSIHCHFIRCLMFPGRIVYNSLLNMYVTCLSQKGYIKFINFSKNDLVSNVFNAIPERDVVSWNTIISWYVKTERYREAVRIFMMTMKMSTKPSSVSFVNVFPAFASIGDYKNANVLYGMLLKFGTEYVNDVFVISSAISLYSELGDLDFARRVFDISLGKNTEVWNSMLSGYVQNGYSLEAINLFLQVLDTEQTLVDDVTFLLALAAVSQLQSLELAQQLHAFVMKNLTVLPMMLFNAVIVMYSRCNSVHTSFRVFENMPDRNVVSWNTMISSFVQNGLKDEALMLVCKMQEQGFKIDSVTVTSLLSAAASNLRSQRIGKQTHGYLLRHGICCICVKNLGFRERKEEQKRVRKKE